MNQLYLNLCKVKALLIKGWAQGETVREPGRTCLFLAVEDVAGPWASSRPLHDAIYNELNSIGWFDGMVEFNDAPGRTKQNVIDIVQRAANRAGGADA